MKLHFLTQSLFTVKLIIISILFGLTSCNNGELDNCKCPDVKKDTVFITVVDDNYYVNYIIQAPGPYGRFNNWTATTPDGIYSNSGTRVSSWNQTYGPIEKGFKCNVQIEEFQGGTPTIEIHISKNEEPFALKKSVTGASASYVID